MTDKELQTKFREAIKKATVTKLLGLLLLSPIIIVIMSMFNLSLVELLSVLVVAACTIVGFFLLMD